MKGEAIDQLLTRTLTIERDQLTTRAAGDERIPVSLSSDAPVERWFGTEVLDHATSAVDMSRAANGLPLLYNHDTDQPIGRIEDVRLRKDGKLVGMVRFSANPKGQEVLRDVLDGILTDMSVGYRINEWVEERTAGSDKATYRATNWTPMEGSITPVAADHTVGVNRSAITTTPAATDSWQGHPYMPASSNEDRGMTRDLETKLIGQVAETFRMTEHLGRWIGTGMSLEEVRADVEKISTRKAQDATPAGYIDLSTRETDNYSIGRALLQLADGSFHAKGGLEREVSDAIAKRSGRSPRGLFMPMNLSLRASLTGQVVGTSSLGGAAVQTTLQPLIELLRNRMVVRQAGARFIPGLTDSISFPRQITSNTFTWTGENPTAANALTAFTLDNVGLSPKTGMVSTSFSRQALIQSSPDMQAMVTDDLATLCAIGLDYAALNGSGSGNEPRGVRNQSGIGNRTLSANGAALDWASLVGFETDIAVGNADSGSIAYLMNSVTRGKLKTTLRSTTAGSSYLWEGGNEGTVNGYRAFATNQLPSNLTAGTNTTIASAIIMADWSQLIIGEWGGAVEILVDPFTSKNQGQIEVTAILMADVALRHPEAFVKSDRVLVA